MREDRMPLRLVFLAAVLIVGRPVTAWPQDWQMYATVGVGAQLVCGSDPTRPQPINIATIA
jgi:low affinity Fe/Cu permease